MRRALLIGVASFALLATAAATALYAGRIDWTDSSLAPFRVNSQLEIASRGYAFKAASLSLLCSEEGSHLMMKARLPIPDILRSDLKPALPATHTAIVLDLFEPDGDLSPRSFSTTSSVNVQDMVDTIVTGPLSAENQAMLTDWFERGAPRGISVHVLEVGTTLSGSATSSSDVAAFFRNCSAA